MSKIQHTNIIIDDFSLAKRQINRVYTHILTHIHTDHLKGLHDGWNYGPIYCTEQTRNMLLHKYPSLSCLVNVPTKIKMSASLQVTVTFLDANHCLGAVMVLIEGYMGRVLYTGDIRFDRQKFSGYSQLYPPELYNSNFEGCSKQIDVLYVDNTFLKRKFEFPPKKEAERMVIDFIQQLLDKNQHSRIFIGLDNIGKEEVIEAIAKHFDVYITVDEQRYQLLGVMGFDPQLFTTKASESFIEVVKKPLLYQRLQEVPKSMGIILSGWVNHPTFRSNGSVYCIPYSLHSNYRQIHEFVNSIRPSFIYPIVHDYPDESKIYYAEGNSFGRKDSVLKEKFGETARNYNEEIEELRRLYCSPPTPEYSLLINDIGLQKKIEEELLPPRLPEFGGSERALLPVHLQTMERKRYRLSNNRDEQEITRLKNKIKMKKMIIEGEMIDNVDEFWGESVSKKQETKVIDLEQDVIERGPEVVEIDSCNQEGADSKSNLKEKNVNFDDELSDSALIKRIKTKLKNKMYASCSEVKPLTSGMAVSSSGVNASPGRLIEAAMDLKRREGESLRSENKKMDVAISEINLQDLSSISIVKSKGQIYSYINGNVQTRRFLLRQFGLLGVNDM